MTPTLTDFLYKLTALSSINHIQLPRYKYITEYFADAGGFTSYFRRKWNDKLTEIDPIIHQGTLSITTNIG